MSTDFTLSEELQFLGLQCVAQANGAHRDEDRVFLNTLIARLFAVAGGHSLRFSAGLIAAASADGASLPAIIRQAGADLAALAAQVSSQNAGRVA